MLLITLLNTLAFLIPSIVCLIVKSNKFFWTINIVTVEILYYFYVYFTLPSRNALSIIAANTCFAILFIVLFKSSNEFSDKDSKHLNNTFAGVMIVATIFLALVTVIGECHSKFAVKATYNSINTSKKQANQAPTFKKGETPVAIAPATVLNRVRKSISDLPNSQYYDVSEQVQAQYYKGKPVYIIPIEYDGFWAMQKANYQIPGYFIIDATRQNATPKFVHKPYSYAVSAYFGHDTSRQLYQHNPEWLKLGDGKAQLEIDDHGNPYWIQTVYKSELFSHRINYKQLHVTAMNAKTGAVTTYNLNQLPS